MKSTFLSRFTPSLMSPEALEAIFVQRDQLSRDVLANIRRGILDSSNRRILLVGPRGVGKTHFISLIYYRIRAMEDLRDRILIAWLREEEWGITSFRDFLLRILRSLPDQISDPSFLETQMASMRRLRPDQAELEAAGMLKTLTSGRSLLILAENLDDLFQRLGAAGQTRFHEFMVENPSFSLVASSTTSFGPLIAPGAPLEGFFQVQKLKDLTFDDAIQLVAKIARFEGNDTLASFITTPRGRARMRALRHFAGGNHRAYVIFSQLLARESLGELMEPLLRTIDDLTPYYQSRMALLTSEQRKIVEYVCEKRHPVGAADLARDCYLPLFSVNAHLDGLIQSGHLNELNIQHERLYELREPLMRLSIEVKKHRGKPIRLLLDFLRLWYSPSELKQRLSALPSGPGLEREYAAPALELGEGEFQDPRVPECCALYNGALARNDVAAALKFAEELVAIRGTAQDISAYAFCLLRLDQSDQALLQYDRVVALNPQDAEAWRLRAWALSRNRRMEESLASCDRAIELKPDLGAAWHTRGSILLALGRPDEAVRSCDRAVALSPRDTSAWTTRGQALAELGLYEEAAASFSSLIALEPNNALAHVHLSAAFLEMRRFESALEEAKTAVELDEEDPVSWIMQGFSLASLGRNSEALQSLERAIAMGEESSLVLFRRAQLLFALDRWRDGAAALDSALSRFARSDNPDAGDTAALVRTLMSKLYGPRILRLCIEVLVLLYQKHNALSPLGRGLIDGIRDVAASLSPDDAALRLWLESWKAAAGSLPEFQLPLRLLDLAVRFCETRDPMVLAEVPQEERALLESLLAVRVSNIA